MPMTTADSVDESNHGHQNEFHIHDHSHDHEEHPDGPFIAHHFETAEQQFDSGKLGMWLFLVQEILFFSGLFVAYIIYRNHNPEIFEAAHVHLDKWLGGLNTIILLFSSLTMAWAVRCSQLEQYLGCIINIVITMVCANIFLGVKAIEYTHKWELGLFWADAYTYGLPQPENQNYLLWLSLPFIVITLLSAGLATFYRVTENDFWAKFFLCIAISFLGYFIGLGIAWAVPAQEHGGHSSDHAVHGSDHGHADGEKHEADDHSGDSSGEKSHEGESHDKSDENHSAKTAVPSESVDTQAGPSVDESTVDEASGEVNMGGFFSIYYIMTGLHAIHILAGIVALTWLLYRTLDRQFRKNYFGPVENVGLYWHLVDLIWIYLFPMMYLIH
jgi:cytochrome c oxidase subunit 3